MLVVIALCATALAGWYGHHYWRIAADEQVTAALAVKPEAEAKLGKSIVGDPYRYFASYRYIDVAGREHAGRQSISRDLYEALSQGDIPLKVHYSRAAPEVSVLDLQTTRWVSLLLAGLAALMWVTAILRIVRG